MTQISASRASRIWFAVRNISPRKIEVWFDISIVEKAMPKMRPTYLARSPSRILRATLFMGAFAFGGAQEPATPSPGSVTERPGLAPHHPTSYNVYSVNHRDDV